MYPSTQTSRRKTTKPIAQPTMRPRRRENTSTPASLTSTWSRVRTCHSNKRFNIVLNTSLISILRCPFFQNRINYLNRDSTNSTFTHFQMWFNKVPFLSKRLFCRFRKVSFLTLYEWHFDKTWWKVWKVPLQSNPLHL